MTDVEDLRGRCAQLRTTRAEMQATWERMLGEVDLLRRAYATAGRELDQALEDLLAAEAAEAADRLQGTTPAPPPPGPYVPADRWLHHSAIPTQPPCTCVEAALDRRQAPCPRHPRSPSHL
jgi:hypothetical protein